MCRTLLVLRLAAAVLLVLLAGCPLPGPVSGSLTITVADNINAKTLLPPISMDASVYTISGTGPGGSTFSRSTDGADVTVEGLAFGDWTVTVEARNSGDTVIGRGQKATTVHTGQTTTVAITVTPLPGDGTLSLAVTWPDAQVDAPSIDASLVSWDRVTTTLDFDVGRGSALLSSSGLRAGYYTLALQLVDNKINVAGAVEVVRIVEAQTTSGSYAFNDINAPGGTIIVNITPELANPIPVSISGVTGTLLRGNSMTASASVDDGTSGVTYVWYLNGVSRFTGQSLDLGADLACGFYRLDVTAFTADGTRAGSTSVSFEAVPRSDGFETYADGSYPGDGWYNLWSGSSAAVTSAAAFSGLQSFQLTGYTGWTRTDGLDIPLAGFSTLTYSVAVMVPSGQATGAAVGFFKRLSGNTSTDFNSVFLSPGGQIRVNGSVGQDTGIICQADTWYDIVVEIDYGTQLLNVWVNGREVVWNLPARAKADSSTFFVGTTWSSNDGMTTAYFDNVSFY